MLKKNPGFTLFELLLTITISSMVMIYAMTVFTDLGKGFRMQGYKNNSQQTLILKKKLIDKYLGNIGTIDIWSSSSITFKELNTDSLITIQFKNGSLIVNNKLICKDLKGFRFDLQENTYDKSYMNNDKVLLWECLSEKDALICGAVVIRE